MKFKSVPPKLSILILISIQASAKLVGDTFHQYDPSNEGKSMVLVQMVRICLELLQEAFFSLDVFSKPWIDQVTCHSGKLVLHNFLA